ncbi:ankyrin repeat domain-containing protein 10 [Biomphalaria glabrata]|nr:ankyrin repeat domain-containing protein 10-like; partial [Biomphalaria glabrata]KAI8761517.1 ankyrin repeat domain-containing protein 10 [Biomphalaria glabrata]
MNFETQPPLPLDSISQQILAQTPLHYACYLGDGHLLDTLIGRALLYNNNSGEATAACVGALISEEDSLNGWTPAHWAAFYGQLSCLMKLNVKPNIGFDTPSHRSNTSPLHLAAQSGAVLCLKWLLQCGASRNKQDFMGETPLHKAAKAGNTDCVAILVNHGASLDLKNHRGFTPGELAQQSNHLALAQYLKKTMEHAEHERSPGPNWNAHTQDPTQQGSAAYNMSFPSREHESRLYSHILMNGERISNDFTASSVDMEEGEVDMAEVCSPADNSTDRMFSGVKRCVDDLDDFDTHVNKRRCFVPSSQKSPEERYGDAYNNNIISSYQSVLAVRAEPVKDTVYNAGSQLRTPGSPVTPQSSMMEHQASVAAQKGYERFVTSAFH